MAKRIKISFIDFWSGFNHEEMLFYSLLKDNYDVEIIEDPNGADYVFFSCFGGRHWELGPEVIKIFFTAENITPDFNICDYGIAFDHLTYGDRYLRLSNFYSTTRSLPKAQLIESDSRRSRANENKKFCSFVVSNAHAAEYRTMLFDKLSQYKHIDSGGRFMNNVGGPVSDKLKFESNYKFSICCENNSQPGYTTEKIYQAFAAGTIPIYWGDPLIAQEFNSDAFVNANDFDTIDDVVSRVIEIDNNESLYQKMINAPIFKNPEESSFAFQQERLREFLYNIFDCDKQAAKRYNRRITGFSYVNRMRRVIELSQQTPRQLLLDMLKRKVKSFFKR